MARESLAMLAEEGLENVFHRHSYLANRQEHASASTSATGSQVELELFMIYGISTSLSIAIRVRCPRGIRESGTKAGFIFDPPSVDAATAVFARVTTRGQD
jgi:hypothetical protein